MSALFVKLLNMSIAAGWLVLAVVVLRVLFKRSPGWARCVMWAMVALRLALPFSFQSAFSVVPSVNTVSVVAVEVSEQEKVADVSHAEPASIPEEPVSQTGTAAEVSYAEPVSNIEYTPLPAPVTEISAPAEYSKPESVHGAAATTKTDQKTRIVINTGIAAVDKSLTSTDETARAAESDGGTDIASVAAYIWTAGAALMLGYLVFSYLRLWFRVRESINKNGVYICDNISSPFVFGVFRPRIYVPSGTDPASLGYVIAHEKAHIRRLDHIWKLVGFILLSVYWFAPLAWLAYILFCSDIELACDENVIRALGADERAGYSEALLALSRPHRAISACPVAFGETGVKERVKKVFSYKKPTVFIIAAALVLCTVLGACLMTDPKDAEEPEYTKEIDMYLHSDYYIEFRIPEDTENIYTIAVKDGVISYRRVYETAGLRKTEDRVLIEKDGVLSLLFTDDRAYLNPTDKFSEVLSSARRGGTKKLVSHTQDGDTETFTFEKDGNTLAFIYEKGELKRMVYSDAGENGALTEREILLFTDKIPDDILFAVPDDYTYAAADTPEDAYGSTVEYCNHYAEYDIKDFDIAAYLEELNNKGFTATLTESADSCYAYINFGKDVVLVERFENAEKAAQAYRDYLRGVSSDGSHIVTMGFDEPPFRSAFRVNEYLFEVVHNYFYDTSTSYVAKMIGLLGINVPVYSGPENRIIKHIDRALDENFAVILTETGYTVVEQDEGALSSLGGRTWLVIAPDGSAATVVRCESKYEAEALVYAHRTTIESGKIPVTVAVLDGGCVVFVHHAAAEEFLQLITIGYPEEVRVITGGEFYMEYTAPGDPGVVVMLACKDGVTSLAKRASDETEKVPDSFVIIGKDGSVTVAKTGTKSYYIRDDITVGDSVLARNEGYVFCGRITSGSGIKYDDYAFKKGEDTITFEYRNDVFTRISICGAGGVRVTPYDEFVPDTVYVSELSAQIPGYMLFSVPEDYKPASVPQNPPEEFPTLTKDDITATGKLTFVSDKYPGKTLVYAGGSDISAAQTPYPFFIQGEELYVMHWKGEDVPVCDGTLVYRFSDTNTKKLSVFACVVDGRLNYDGYDGCKLMRFGELLIKYRQTDPKGSPIYGTVYGFTPSYGPDATGWVLEEMYDKSALREGGRFFAFRCDGELYESPEWWYLVDTEGNLYTLPVPYEKRKSIERITFDPSSGAADDVLVYVYETHPDMAEAVPVPYTANLNDCRPFTSVEDYLAYYTLSDAERRSYAVPSELSEFAPKTITVYRNTSPADEKAGENVLTAFIRSFDPAFESAAFETTGTGAVTVSYGDNATFGFRDGSLWVYTAYGSVAPASVWLTTGNLLDQDIPYLDEMIEYYGFDRSKLQVTVGDGGFYIAEYSGGLESAVEAIGRKSLHVSVSNNAAYAVTAYDRSAFTAEKRGAIPFSAAYEEFLKGNIIIPGMESEDLGEAEAYLIRADIVYASGIELKDDIEFVYPYYRFYISTQYDPAPFYAYVRAAED